MTKPEEREPAAAVAPTSRALSEVAPSRRASALETTEEPERDVIFCMLGTVTRSGGWIPPEFIDVTAGLGNVKLDFVQAALPVGITEIQVNAVLGNVEIVVPAHVEVDLSGYSILGSLEHRVRKTPLHERIFQWLKGDRRQARPDPGPKTAVDRPEPASEEEAADPADEPVVLIVRAWSVLGNIRIERV